MKKEMRKSEKCVIFGIIEHWLHVALAEDQVNKDISDNVITFYLSPVLPPFQSIHNTAFHVIQ